MKYKTKVQGSFSLWYLGIYILSMAIIYWALIRTSVISAEEGSYIYRIWGSAFFLFGISIRFREDFNFMLTMSHTRRAIYFAHMGTIIVFSALFSGFILLERILVDHLNRIHGYANIVDPCHFFSPYTAESLILQFFYFLALLYCLSAAGLLLGVLFYRLGKKFTFMFWLIFSGIPFLVLPAIAWSMHKQGMLSENLRWLGIHLTSFNVMNASLWLFAIGLLLSGVIWATIRRISQR